MSPAGSAKAAAPQSRHAIRMLQVADKQCCGTMLSWHTLVPVLLNSLVVMNMPATCCLVFNQCSRRHLTYAADQRRHNLLSAQRRLCWSICLSNRSRVTRSTGLYCRSGFVPEGCCALHCLLMSLVQCRWLCWPTFQSSRRLVKRLQRMTWARSCRPALLAMKKPSQHLPSL